MNARESLLDELYMAMTAAGAEQDVRNDLYIILDKYEITQRTTELAILDEDRNETMMKRFLIAKTVKGCTPRTIQYYRATLAKALPRIGKTVDEITADDIRLYFALRGRKDGVTKVTVGNEERVLSSFFEWLRVEEILIKNPMDKVERVRQKRAKKKAFTDYQVELIRGACRTQQERAIIEVLLSTGCRCGELILMRRSELNGEKIVVHGKGEKDRTVYLNAKAQIELQKYLTERSDGYDWIFPKGTGASQIMKTGTKRLRSIAMRPDWYKNPELLVDDHTGISHIEELVRGIGKRAGVEDCHPHRFRRTCATTALRRGMPIEQVSQMLGHEQLSTTQIYLDLSEEDLAQAHKKYVV